MCIDVPQTYCAAESIHLDLPVEICGFIRFRSHMGPLARHTISNSLTHEAQSRNSRDVDEPYELHC